MKSEKILDALGNIDDRLILDCLPLLTAHPKRRRTGQKLAMAACLALLLLGAGRTWMYLNELSNKDIPALESPTVTEDHGQEEPQTPDLPMLTLGSDYGKNSVQCLEMMEEELLNTERPIDLENLPETLPVYQAAEPDEAALDALLRAASERMDMESEPEWDETGAHILSDRLNLSVDWSGTFTVSPRTESELLTLPEDCTDASLTGASAAASYLLEQYGDQLDMKQPEALLLGGAERNTPFAAHYDVVIYDAAGDAGADLQAYWHHSVTFRLCERGVYRIEVKHQTVEQVYGDYPIMTPQEAQDLFLRADVGKEMPEIVKTELIYPDFDEIGLCVPLYRFLVEQPLTEEEQAYSGLKVYMAYAVPAVRPEYVVDYPDGWLYVEDAVLGIDREANITAVVALEDQSAQADGCTYRLMAYDGFDIGAYLLPEDMQTEWEALVRQNNHTSEGSLVFLDNSPIPTYFVEQETLRVLYTRTGKVDGTYLVWAGVTDTLAEAYQNLMTRAQEALYACQEELHEMQYLLHGEILELNEEDRCLILNGTAERYDGTDSYTGEMRLSFQSATELNLTDDFFVKAYFIGDLGSAGTWEGRKLFSTIELAEQEGWVDQPNFYRDQIDTYLKILENAPLLEGIECAYALGDYEITFLLPTEWEGKYEVSGEDTFLTFYHKASVDTVGRLFQIGLMSLENGNEYQTYANFQRILASDGAYALVLFMPTDVQFSSETAEEYQAMSAQIESIADTMEMKRP